MKQDFIEGWKAARAHYQLNGSVPPYPPGAPPQAAPADAHVRLDIKSKVHQTKLRPDQIPDELEESGSPKTGE